MSRSMLPVLPVLTRRPLRRPLESTSSAGVPLPMSAPGGVVPLAEPERAPRRDPLLALVQRITFGATAAEYERAQALGYEGYLEEQLHPEAIDDSAMEARLAPLTTLALSPAELLARYAEDFTEPYLQTKGAVILRAIHSRRQLLERTCELWNDHFSIHHEKSDFEWVFLPEHDRLVTRAHALGSFPALLSGVTHGAAMLFYLDNWLNVRGAPQENHARELLELHTLGVDGGYTEADVEQVARCMTGWTLDVDPGSGAFLRARFDGALHAPGDKLVLGQVIPASAPRDNLQRVLDVVALQPATARTIAGKLLRHFLTPAPPAALVASVAAEFMASGGDVRATLRAVLARENMGFTGPVAPKFRRPFHLVVVLLRALGADVADPLYPLFHLLGMGHAPFGHPQPDGYPDTAAAWAGGLLARWRFASDLLGPRAVFGTTMPGVALAFPRIAAACGWGGPGDRAGLAARIDAGVLGGTLGRRDLEVLQGFVDAYPGGFGAPALLETIALGASLPGFQWY